MRHYRIIFLLLSSLLLSSCLYNKITSFTKQKDVQASTRTISSFIPTDKAVKYKASIDVLNKHFTGIIVIKQTDTETKHLVFLTELGMRMFDFEWKRDSMKPVFVFDPLNKPNLVAALTKNFETIFMVKSVNKTAKSYKGEDKEVVHLKDRKKDMFFIDHKEFPGGGHLMSIQWVFNRHKHKSRTIYTNNYNNIKLKQYGLVKFYIELEKINE
jgi:hypothetical protein